MKKFKLIANRLICAVFGHKEQWVIEERSRVERKNGSWKNRKVRMVRGIYKECARCGKKMSDFQRTLML